MKTGPLWMVSVATTAEAEEAVLLMLERLHSVPASSCTDMETGAVVASVFLDKKRGKRLQLRLALARELARLRDCGLELSPARISIRLLRPENWAESWKRHFRPIEISPALVIQPSWSKRRPRPGQSVVVLDPGLSFGTGQHPTTAFCLKQLAARIKPAPAPSFLDIGCGSGILAIAAAKLGYWPVEGFDFDPDAIRVAKANAAQNEVEPRLFQADVSQLPIRSSIHARRRRPTAVGPHPRRPRYDLVCANLIYDLLLAEKRRIIARVAPGGSLVLAGILKNQFDAVQKAYEEEGLACVKTGQSGLWKSGLFRRMR